MSLEEREYVIDKIHKNYNPFYQEPHHEDIGQTRDKKIAELEDQVRNQNEILIRLEKKIK